MSTYWNFDKPVYTNKRYVADYAFTMPEDCTNYARYNIENYDTITSLPEKYLTADYSKIINANYLFAHMVKCKEFPNLNLNSVNTDLLESIFYNTGITRIPHIEAKNVYGINCLFRNTTNLKYAELKNIVLDEKKINTAANVFWTSQIEELLSIFDIGNCTIIDGFFSDCPKLKNVCYINTKRGTNFHDFFNNTAITGLDWEINLQCAINVSHMFNSCPNLLDGGITLINVPRTLDLSTIGCASSKYTVKNYIETALDPSEVVD